MKALPRLDELSHEKKDALIRALWDELQTLRSDVETLKQKRVKKTSRNSSLPPSKGFKANQSKSESSSENSPIRPKHTGGGRELHPCPDQTMVAQAKRCPHCGSEVRRSTQSLIGKYERIELPPVTPYVTQVQRYGGTCECCQKQYESPVPVGLEPGSPFGI